MTKKNKSMTKPLNNFGNELIFKSKNASKKPMLKQPKWKMGNQKQKTYRRSDGIIKTSTKKPKKSTSPIKMKWKRVR